jgi:hypothetical protein
LPHKEPAEHPKQLQVVAEYRADAGMIHPLTVERGMTRRNGSVMRHPVTRRGYYFGDRLPLAAAGCQARLD